jgi:methyl-accepting chemotaxis protein
MDRWTFTHKVVAGFAAVVALAVVMAFVGVWALRSVVSSKDRVITVHAQNVVDAERLHALSAEKASVARAHWVERDPKRLDELREIRAGFTSLVARLKRAVYMDDARQLVDEIGRIEEEHARAVQATLDMSAANAPIAAIDAKYVNDGGKALRGKLDGKIDDFIALQQRRLDEGRVASNEAAADAQRLIVVIALGAVAAAAVIAFLLSKVVTRQVSSAVRHVQSSSTELQAVAGQQAAGAREQASAMAEITTTISELLATSRQIAESAQRVAAIADETAAAAGSGDQIVLRSQESVGGIRRQVELIVGHMLELGKKSQQIGGILEIINELAEQTNILAINATIEAAGAGESGKRFAVVADEIRKLADRVGGATKDIRILIEEIRSAVNTTVMATETGSKAVEAGARQFSDVASAFRQIAALVATTTEAAREIELSTKQQSTAVEQVNIAIGNVAQASREAETSTGQALQTASQLAAMSRDLARLVQPQAQA